MDKCGAALGQASGSREKKHMSIVSSINRLTHVKKSIESLFVDIGGLAEGEVIDGEDNLKSAHPTLSEILDTAPKKIVSEAEEIQVLIEKIRSLIF